MLLYTHREGQEPTRRKEGKTMRYYDNDFDRLVDEALAQMEKAGIPLPQSRFVETEESSSVSPEKI